MLSTQLILQKSKKMVVGGYQIRAIGGVEQNFTEGEFSNSQNDGRNVYKEVAIMWKNKERSVD
jgi:hypothetical protein